MAGAFASVPRTDEKERQLGELNLQEVANTTWEVAKVGYLDVKLFAAPASVAMTSTRRAMRWLGRNWKRLHTGVYLALAFASVHYLLMIRSEWAWPVSYAVIALMLLLVRLRRVMRPQG